MPGCRSIAAGSLDTTRPRPCGGVHRRRNVGDVAKIEGVTGGDHTAFSFSYGRHRVEDSAGDEVSAMYDLIVIGGGPAGASAAITAARNGVRVLLLERGRFPRQKVCGEFVSAESWGMLDDLLDVRHRALLAGAVRIERTRVFLDERVLQARVDPRPPALRGLISMMRFGVPPRPQARKPVTKSQSRKFEVRGRFGENVGRGLRS